MFCILPADKYQIDADVAFTNGHRLLPHLIHWTSTPIVLSTVSELIASRTHFLFNNTLGRSPETNRIAPKPSLRAPPEPALRMDIILTDGEVASPEIEPADEMQQGSDLLSSKNPPPEGIWGYSAWLDPERSCPSTPGQTKDTWMV